MENFVKVLNNVKKLNEINSLKKEVQESSEKSKEYMNTCKKIVVKNQITHNKEIEEKQKEIGNLNQQLDEQKALVVSINEENNKLKKILSRIPKWILFIFKRRI